MKGYSSYYKKKNKKARYLFLSFAIVISSYFIIRSVPKLPFLNLGKKKYSTIERMLEKHDKEKDRSEKKFILNRASKNLNKLINDPDVQEDGYLAFLAGSLNFRKGLS